MKNLSLPSFKHLGMKNKGSYMDCVEMPLAYGASKYNMDFFYAFYMANCYTKHWGKNDKSFISHANSILSTMGLYIKEEPVASKDDFVERIIQSIDQGHPVFLFFDYYNMFYDIDHYLRDHIFHGVLITGYDDERNTFILQESSHIHFEELRPFQLTADMAWQIFAMSNYRKDAKVLYIFNKKAYAPISLPIIKVMENFYCNSGITRDLFEELIVDFGDLENSSVDQAAFRRNIYNSMVLLLEFIEKIAYREHLTDFLQEFNRFQNTFLEFRNSIVLKILKNAIKGTHPYWDHSIALIEANRKLTQQLFQYIMDFTEMLKMKYGSTNYAFNANVTASSESCFKGKNFSCSNLVNGIHDFTSLDNMWANAENDFTPWLIFDFKQPTSIKTFVLYHYSDICVSDFYIEGSNDRENWEEISAVFDNKESVTRTSGNGKKYRYYKIDITKPSAVDNAARLYQFEAWG